MRRARARLVGLVMIGALGGLWNTPALAAPSVYARVLAAYQATGAIPPCEFSSGQLQSALKGIDTYGAQYFSDFATAVQTALSQRAGGACEPGAGRNAVALPLNTGRAYPIPLGSVTASTGAGLPLPILLMAVLLALAALAALLTAAARWQGWQPAWALRWRQAWAETAHRAAATWLDFLDWRRSG